MWQLLAYQITKNDKNWLTYLQFLVQEKQTLPRNNVFNTLSLCIDHYVVDIRNTKWQRTTYLNHDDEGFMNKIYYYS